MENRFQLLDENQPELFDKHDIDDKVHTWIERDGEIRKRCQSIIMDQIKGFQNIHQNGEKIAAQEDDDNTKEHCRELDVLSLFAGQLQPKTVNDSHLSVDHQVEERYAHQRSKNHEEEVQPMNVNFDVSFVPSERWSYDKVELAIVGILSFY